MDKAEGDLRSACYLLALPQQDYFAVAFHAQQAAEKFLKAFLVRHQIPFRKTHDIQELLGLAASVTAELKAELVSAAMLTPFGVDFRYPGEQVADLRTAQEAVEESQRVRNVVRKQLAAYLLEGRPEAPLDPS